MGFFDRLFGKNIESRSQPDIRFGRYSDSYKDPDNYDAWDRALDKFEKDAYLDSFRQFFRYLRDEDEDNVQWEEEEGIIRFDLFQGSKKITGVADTVKLKAEAKIAQAKVLNVGFMRRLIEKNFQLKYSRFALDPENNISIVFDTYALDGSPYKLYYALKELATNADKQDDLLLDEFEVLNSIETSHLSDLPGEEKEIKYDFIKKKIEDVLHEVGEGNLDQSQYPGGIAYLLLDLVYKLDYLIRPEGYMMETLERIHRLYFSKDSRSTAHKNQLLCKQLQELIDRPKTDFFKEMYLTTSTFGITTPVNHDRIVGFIDGELGHMDWYEENNHPAIALAVPGYIVGYCMFNYAVPRPDRDLFHLYYQIMEPEYFRKLGFTPQYYHPESGKFEKRAIVRAIERIAAENRDRFYKMKPATRSLRYESPTSFAKSFLMMVKGLDLTKVE